MLSMFPHNRSPGPSVATTDGAPRPSVAAIGGPLTTDGPPVKIL